MSSTLDNSEVLMLDNFPGVPNVNGAGPFDKGNVANGADQNWYVSGEAPPHVLGTKWYGYQEGGTGVVAGGFTLIYLKTGTLLAATVAVNKLHAMTIGVGAATSSDLLYTVTDNPATPIGMLSGQCAVSMSTMTSGGYYGWFWCGGVCPTSVCTGMDTTLETNGSAVNGYMIAISDTEVNFGPFPDTGAYIPVAICLAATDA